MNFNRWIGTSLMLASLAGSAQILNRRRTRDLANRTVLLAVDYDDCLEISTRSGMALTDLLHDLWHRGASHVGITEQTLGDLLDAGRVLLAQPPAAAAAAGVTHLSAPDPQVLERLAAALALRVPHLANLAPETVDNRTLLAVPGSLQHLRGVTVGFEPGAFELAQAAGLVPVARPRHYPWPHPTAIEAVLAQAASLGSPLVAFAYDYVLGHEMFMQATIHALRTHHLTPVYFAESRHQKGDWFIAKACLPDVVLGHEFTPADLDLEDEHGMAHKWGRMADRGVRFFSIGAMRGVHATDPLSLRDYVSMVLGELVTARGLQLAGRPDFEPPVAHRHGHGHHHHQHEHPHNHAHEHDHEHDHVHTHDDDHAHHDEPSIDLPHHQAHAHSTGHEHAPASPRDPVGRHEATHSAQDRAPDAPATRAHHGAHDHDHGVHDALAASSGPERSNDLRWVALAAAGAGGIAAGEALDLPEPWASLLTLAAAGVGWVAVPLVDRPRNALEAAFPPSYAPKAIGLGLAVAAPIAGVAAARLHGASRGPGVVMNLLLTGIIHGTATAGLAATVASEPYRLRVEEFRSYNLDWAVPLGLAAGQIAGGAARPGSERAAGLMGAGAAALGAWLLSSRGPLPADLLGPWISRPLQGHTHHLSAFQARVGDLRLAASPQPLAKWGWLLPVGAVLATTRRGRGAGLLAATVGSITLLAPFRQGAPALDETVDAAVRGLTAGLVHAMQVRKSRGR